MLNILMNIHSAICLGLSAFGWENFLNMQMKFWTLTFRSAINKVHLTKCFLKSDHNNIENSQTSTIKNSFEQLIDRKTGVQSFFQILLHTK